MKPETNQMIKESAELLDDTCMDLLSILPAYHEKRFDVLSASLMRINNRIQGASATIRNVIFKETIMPEAEKLSESGEVIAAEQASALKKLTEKDIFLLVSKMLPFFDGLTHEDAAQVIDYLKGTTSRAARISPISTLEIAQEFLDASRAKE